MGFTPYVWEFQVAVDSLLDALPVPTGPWEDGGRAGVGVALARRQAARAAAPRGLSANVQPRHADHAALEGLLPERMCELSMNTNSQSRRDRCR